MNTTSVTHVPKILGIDAGGTMTDSFVVDANGEFVVGKSQTTPENESEGFEKSLIDALNYWHIPYESAFESMVSGIYSGTSMINRLIERRGSKVGLIVNRGMEDILRLERAVQTYLGYSYNDRLHVATHRHNDPLVARERIRGAYERIDIFGDVVLPLNEDQARQSISELLELDIEYLCVCLLWSFKNPAHELRIKEMAHEIMAEKGIQVPVFCSVDYYPVRGEQERLNALVIEAYASDPSRHNLQKISQLIKSRGGEFDLRIMSSHGGGVSVDSKGLARTLISGPIGGVIGAKYFSEVMKIENIACTDVGGTSLDIALITAGQYEVKSSSDVARFVIGIPYIRTDSVAAGTGSYVRVDPNSNRVEFGPDSAGARVGVCYEEGGVDTVTITDCDVILGYINPDYFLGGDIKLNKDRAIHLFKEQVADKLNLDVYEAAAGIIELFESGLANSLRGVIVGKGYGPENFTCLSYGGGGPLHVAGYMGDMNFEDVLVPTWAAGFSAFGCTCADLEYRFESTCDLPLADFNTETVTYVAEGLNQVWKDCRERIEEEFTKSNIDSSKISYKYSARLQYMGQLDDLEIMINGSSIESLEDLKELTDSFEDTYSKVFSRAAKSPELGYFITRAVATGVIDVVKPTLPDLPLGKKNVDQKAKKTDRDAYFNGSFVKAGIFEMSAITPGNVIRGPAIIEDPATTLVLPPGVTATMDNRLVFHLTSNKNK